MSPGADETSGTEDHAGPAPVPAAPAVAATVCGDALPTVAAYADMLATGGVTRGLIGHREVPRLWERHLLNCAAVSALVPERASVADLGTGAGLPGIVLAAVRPDIAVTLVEPMLRRTSFLEEAVAGLGLANATVLRGRAEEFHGKHSFDVVTSRALAPLDRVLEWSLPLVRPTGTVLALKGARVEEEIAATEPVQRRWQCTAPRVVTVGDESLETPTRVAVVTWTNPEQVSDPPRTPGAAGGNRRQRGGRRGNGRRRRRGR